MVPQIDDFLSLLNVFLCYRGNTAYTTELHGLSGQLCLYRFRKVPLGTSRFIKCPEGYRGGVWGGEGGERGETLGEVGMKAPSHFGVHFHTKAGFKKTSQKRPPI